MNILITGCGSGLGKVLSENKNHNIFPHYRHTDNPSSDCIVGDLTDTQTLDKFSQFLNEKNIDVFINNAGKYLGKPIEESSDDEIVELMNVNLLSSILLLKRVYSFFKQKKSGMIININSLAGKTASPNESVYCSSKFGLHGFSKSLQLEAIGTGIKIIDLYPGAIKTRMTKHRPNYENLMSPNDIASLVYSLIENDKTYYQNEIILRKN